MRLQRKVQRTQGPVWLNVGAGGHVEPGFVNLDNHPYLWAAPLYPLLRLVSNGPKIELIRQYFEGDRRGVYVRYDCRKPLGMLDGTVDHILCSHFLEHVYRSEAETILRGFLAALRPGGTAHLIVPDLALLAKAYVDGTNPSDVFVRSTLLSWDRAPSWRYRGLEALGFGGLQHRWMYDGPTLEALCREVGFELLEENNTPSKGFRRGDGESIHVVCRKPAS